MELLIVPVPIFNSDLVVESYYFRYQKGNDYLGSHPATSYYDGASISPALETLNMIGVEAFTISRLIFVPIDEIMLLGNLCEQCLQDPAKIIFLLDSGIKSEEIHVKKIKELKEKGFRFAFNKIPEENFDYYGPVLELGDFIFRSVKNIDLAEFKAFNSYIKKEFKNLEIIATHIDSFDKFEQVKGTGVNLFEGRFYRTPINKGQKDISPLKANLVRLLNIVRDENFEFDVVSDIVQRDTALTVSLLRLVNSPFIGLRQKVKTINHAVTILGQNEVRKWVTTSVSRLLGADKPNEVTKLSLIRAKFAENLAPLFLLEKESQSLFLTGLFSVLNVILDVSMEDALKMVQVSDEIAGALLHMTGKYAPVMQFIYNYERADWAGVSRMLILYDIDVAKIYDSYTEAMLWYTDLILDEVKPNRKS